jgi:hypothetical protein
MRILCKISHICIKISNNETEQKLNYVKFEVIPHSKKEYFSINYFYYALKMSTSFKLLL